MALQGNLRDFSVTEILQLLGTQKKTGCLVLEWNTEHAKVHIMDGRIISTRDPGMTPDDPLLQFLIKVHRISDEQRRGLQSIQRESGRDFEDLVVTGRYIEADELRGYLERQILNDLMRLVRWENGGYRFDPKQAWRGTPLVRLSMEGALIEAARRVDEQKRFVTRFKDPYEVLGVHDLPDPDEPLSDEERELFGIIDGQRTVAEVVDSAPLSEYEAYESLHRMLEAGWIVVAGRRDPGLTLAPSPMRPITAPTTRVSFINEVLVAAVVVAALLGFQFGSRAWRSSMPARTVVSDVFASTRVRDLELALQFYHRDHGTYPKNLPTLVEEEWLAPHQIQVAGYNVNYRPAPGGQTYELILKPDR